MARVQQLAEGPHQLGDVVEVQAGGGLIEQEQPALLGHRLARRAGRLGQEAGQLQALRLAAAERGHRLAQAHIVQTHVHDGLQHTHHLAVVAEQLHRFAHGEFQHVGDAELAVHLAGQPALDLHVQQLGPVAAAVAVGAAQVHVRQELHLHMLEARAAAGGAAAITGIEAEHAGAVAPLTRQRRIGKQLADLVEGAHVAGGVGARGLADRALVHEHRIGQPVGAQQPVVLAGAFGGLAEVAGQRGVQHVLHQRALARAGNAGDHHHALQRKAHRHVLQVVLAHAFEDELGRGLVHQPGEARAHMLAAAQVGAGQRVGLLDGVGVAVEHDLAAPLARAGTHVDQAVGGQHHRRVVLHHHQRVARIAQPVHGLHDAVHVARVQPDAGLIEHEHGVDQRGAQRGGEVDALHLAARQRAALPVEREVADAHVAQVLQAGADLFMDQLQRRVMRAAQHPRVVTQAVEEAAQAVDAQLHQVVQAQPGQGFQLLAAPLDAVRHEALLGRQHRIGLGLAADAPQQRLELEPRAGAGGAFGVAAVLGQEHPDVHLVGLALQVLEKAVHAVPLLVPVAVPVRRAVDHPVPLGLGELVPGGVARNAGVAGVLHQVVLALLPGGRLHRLDGAVAQGLALVRDHQPHVHADDATEAAAGLAGAEGGVEREQRRRGVGIADVALGAVQAGGPAPDVGLAVVLQRIHVQAPAAALERQLDGLGHAHRFSRAGAEAVGHHIQLLSSPQAWGCRPGATPRGGSRGLGRPGAARPRFNDTLGLHPGEATGRQPLLHLLGAGVARQLHRKGEHQPRVARRGGACQQLGLQAGGCVMAHRQRRLAVEQLGGPREQQLQVVVQLGHRADRGARGAHRVGLVDGDGRRHAVHPVDRRAVHAVEKLARIGAEGFDVTALAFGVQRVEHQAALARAAGARDHRHVAGAQVEIEVLEVVLASAADADDTGGHGVLL